jgi:dTDP-6-deoxy-L-talose 4-dehydrogenase (NAD+)
MRVAVTGASGFVGQYVLRELARRTGIEIVAMTRQHPALVDVSTAIQQVPFDIDTSATDAYARLGRPDVLIHLAWATLSNYKSPLHFESHLVAHYRFLKSLIQAGLPALLCTGTCFEYGMRSGELVESMQPQPHNPYGYAKDALRCQLEFLRKEVPFQLTWARPFYMFGEGQSAASLYSLVMAAGKRGDGVFPMSPGDQLRDYLHVADVARYLVALALDAPGSGIVNICSGKPVAVRTLVEGWLRQNGWRMSLELGRFPYPDYEPLAFWGSAARLSEVLAGRAAP